jgi:hypothetical protein
MNDQHSRWFFSQKRNENFKIKSKCTQSNSNSRKWMKWIGRKFKLIYKSHRRSTKQRVRFFLFYVQVLNYSLENSSNPEQHFLLPRDLGVFFFFGSITTIRYYRVDKVIKHFFELLYFERERFLIHVFILKSNLFDFLGDNIKVILQKTKTN